MVHLSKVSIMGSYAVMIQTDEDDRNITESALAESGKSIPVRFLASMEELEEVVKTDGPPSLILLNDEGAAHKGHAKLKRLKSMSSIRHVPVIILGEVSTSDYIKECYRAGANSFIIKPSTVRDTNKKISLFFDYWFDVAECGA